MKTTSNRTPTSRCRLGLSRCDITPPIGIYHRFWGAAKHDRATGVHRPLTATVVVIEPSESAEQAARHVFIALDHCLFRATDMDLLSQATANCCGLETEQITFFFSHTHSGGNLSRNRAELPGGELIGPYLDALPEKCAATFRTAVEEMSDATLTYAKTDCNMGHHRDCFDEQSDQYVCGFNPDVSWNLPVNVIRAVTDAGVPLATFVNYPCHPTTLAWDNTLISPDYVGALRETVESATGVPCVFLLAPCGDIGPVYGYVGDTQVADGNGRQVGFAALSALESMPPVATDYHYTGPVFSGATIGVWEHQPFTEERKAATAGFRHRRWQVLIDYLSDLPTQEETEQELQQLTVEETAARQAGDDEAAQQARALAERKRRLLERIGPLPTSEKYPLSLQAWQLGDAFWVAVEGEPYHWLQQELNRRFPENSLIVMPLANGSRCSYLPTREAYEKPLYQVDVALLAAGSLETVAEELAAQIETWLAQ